MNLVPGVGDERVLATDALIDVGHDQEIPPAAALAGDHCRVTESSHQALQRVQVGLAALDSGRDVMDQLPGAEIEKCSHHFMSTAFMQRNLNQKTLNLQHIILSLKVKNTQKSVCCDQ